MVSNKTKQVIVCLVALSFCISLFSMWGYMDGEKRIDCVADGEFDYIDFYKFDGGNGTVERLVFRIASYNKNCSISMEGIHSDILSFQVEIFRNGAYQVGFIHADMEQVNTITVHNVTITIKYYCDGANSFDKPFFFLWPLVGVVFGSIFGFAGSLYYFEKDDYSVDC